jgi:CHAT domain-containing protein/Tfp pilus assembly protein PilF
VRPLALALAVLLPPAAAAAHGVVVEEVTDGFAAHKAGLRPGDVIVAWERAAAPPANPEPAQGEVASPFDLELVERDQAPRGDVTLRGTRGGAALRVLMPPGGWRMEVRPPLGPADLEAYEAARKAAGGGAEGHLSAWDRLARRLGEAEDHAAASWLFLRIARAAAEKRNAGAAAAAFQAAVQEAEATGAPAVVASVQGVRARYFDDRGEWDQALAAYAAALAAYRAGAPEGLGEAWVHSLLGIMARKRGDPVAAEEALLRALAIRERLAPGSLSVAQALGSLGIVARNRGDLPAAEDYQRRSLVIRERLAPESVDVAAGLNNLGVVLHDRSDLVGAEEHFRRALAIREKLTPDSLEAADVIGNLGLVAETRGDLARAEEVQRRVLAIYERRAPGSLGVSQVLTNLGNLAGQRDELAAAEDYYRRSLAIKEKLAPRSIGAAISHSNLGWVTWKRGDLAAAQQHLERALAIHEVVAPRSLESSTAWSWLGDVALSGGDPAAAEGHYRRALEIRRERAPGSATEAEAFRSLAVVYRRQNRPQEALEHYAAALAALDAQRRTLGGTDETRTRFSVRYAPYYHEAVDLLLDLDRPQEAFHVLERYRARGLLSLLAERDLVFSADIPEELDRARRLANADYDRARAQLAEARGDEVARRREALDAVRRRQTEVQEKIRSASPRLATLHYPEPLDLAAGRRALDAGTLLLSYSIGAEKSHLVAVGPGADDFTAVPLDITLRELRGEVARFRQALQQGGRLSLTPLQASARRLGSLLLGPVAGPLARAERVLVLPDGPLHLVPFAALADPTAAQGLRYLVEATPVHVAASVTVSAELAKRRRPGRPATMVAFGDPDYSGLAAAPSRPVPPGVSSARERGLALSALPAARQEVEALERLFPTGSRTYVGAEATEERAKSVGPGVSLVHFACHGLADERTPLDSSLALAVPRDWQPGRDNGLLQAWEIFERVRIDADLVTLSACSTGMGGEMSGEGILGLTRAFQYAGAKSVLASLWEVNDASTAELMRRFYGHLRQGRSKDRALRAAQVEMIRRPGSAHPNRWAAFQLVGDWQ